MGFTIFRATGLLLLPLVVVSGFIPAAEPISFARQIAPLLAKRCLVCHSARVAEGRVDLENYTAILRGGAKGKTVVPGAAQDSLLYLALADGSMPQESDPFGPGELTLVRNWIDSGAPLDPNIDPEDSLWNVLPREPHPLPPQRYPFPVPISCLTFSPDGKWLASSGYHEVLLWEVSSGRLWKRIPQVAQRIFAIDFAPDGKRLAVASGTPGRVGETQLFDTATGTLQRTYLTTRGPLFAVRFSPDGRRLATAGKDRVIRVFDVADGSLLQRMPDHHKQVLDLAWSPDGSHLASAGHDKNAKVFDSRGGQQLSTYHKSAESDFAGLVYGVTFAPDGERVISCGNDRRIRIWRATDAKLSRRIDSHEATVFRVVATPNGQLFSCSADQTVRVHSLDTGKLLRTYSDHSEWVYSIAVHPASKTFASGSFDGEIRIRRIDDGRLLHAFVATP
ncbi:MAG: c-type cytochrome domain-containing protein [Planctomycetota bacterium]|nr:c-type cytochrome domain-containing protein [Planctomycetota bacterium]